MAEIRRLRIIPHMPGADLTLAGLGGSKRERPMRLFRETLPPWRSAGLSPSLRSLTSIDGLCSPSMLFRLRIADRFASKVRQVYVTGLFVCRSISPSSRPFRFRTAKRTVASRLRCQKSSLGFHSAATEVEYTLVVLSRTGSGKN